MAHTAARKGLLALTTLALVAPLSAATAAAAPQRGAEASPITRSPLDDARLDVSRGRVVLLGGGVDAETVRRGETVRADGRAQVEVTAGSQVRIRWVGTMSIEVFGPSSLEWYANQGSVHVVFHELAWADVEARSGQHTIALPADWHADFGKTSMHLRGLSGGPTELRCNAGDAVKLEWRGSNTELLPPVSVFAGSSVRLDRPRFARKESPESRRRLGAWTAPKSTAEDAATWPFRERTDTPADVQERAVLGRETQSLTKRPGAETGNVTQLRTYEADGSSSVRPITRKRDRSKGTYAQVPVSPRSPRYEIETKEKEAGRQALPRRTESAPAVRPSVPRAKGPSSRLGSRGAAETSIQKALAPTAVPFDRAQWRGLERSMLNGTGEVAAERGSGVEVRVLGSGRTKVFVNSSSPSPRWCFTPTIDFLMHPGAVAVFEADGTMRMSFGDVEEKTPLADRPSFSGLAK